MGKKNFASSLTDSFNLTLCHLDVVAFLFGSESGDEVVEFEGSEFLIIHDASR